MTKFVEVKPEDALEIVRGISTEWSPMRVVRINQDATSPASWAIKRVWLNPAANIEITGTPARLHFRPKKEYTVPRAQGEEIGRELLELFRPDKTLGLQEILMLGSQVFVDPEGVVQITVAYAREPKQ